MNRYERLRYAAGLSLTDLAIKTGISRGTLRALEQDDTKKPSAPHARSLCDVYEISLEELLGIEEAAA